MSKQDDKECVIRRAVEYLIGDTDSEGLKEILREEDYQTSERVFNDEQVERIAKKLLTGWKEEWKELERAVERLTDKILEEV